MFKIFAGILLVAVGAIGTAQASESAIRSAFATYSRSVINNDADIARVLVTENTIRYYHTILQLALHANESIVRKANMSDRMLILMVRHRIPHKKLLKMDGEALFSHAVRNGWIGKNGVDKLEVGSVAIRDDTARVVMMALGRPTPIHLTMRHEGQWRVDLTSILPVTNEAFGQAVSKLGMTENDFILLTLDSLSGRTVPDTIWRPIVQR